MISMMFFNFLKNSARTLINGLVLGVAFMFPSFTALAADQLLDDFKYSAEPTNIKQNLAQALMEANGAIVIDVRTKEEYDAGHIENAYLVPLDELNESTIAQHKDLKLLKEKDTPVLLYCRSGRRSGIVMNAMAKAGFKNVMNMGGVITWEYGLTTELPKKSFAEAVKDVTPYQSAN